MRTLAKWILGLAIVGGVSIELYRVSAPRGGPMGLMPPAPSAPRRVLDGGSCDLLRVPYRLDIVGESLWAIPHATVRVRFHRTEDDTRPVGDVHYCGLETRTLHGVTELQGAGDFVCEIETSYGRCEPLFLRIEDETPLSLKPRLELHDRYELEPSFALHGHLVTDLEPPRDIQHVFLSTYPYELPVRATVDWWQDPSGGWRGSFHYFRVPGVPDLRLWTGAGDTVPLDAALAVETPEPGQRMELSIDR